MKIKSLALAFGSLLFLPFLAHADTQGSPVDNSFLTNLFETVLPFVLIGLLVWFFFSKTVRKAQNRSNDYIAVQKQHNERVEQLLERIAKALEKKDNDSVS